tara:strand:+ start:1293 stop:2375 length:1083 start_codon:yes stop_codon:yes gene_type:complete
MALSDDIKQLVRREQDIQGVLGVLDTYLKDRQKRRDDYKPQKEKVVKITEINEDGDTITRFVPESEALKSEGYLTKKKTIKDPTQEQKDIDAVEEKYGPVLNRPVTDADVSFFSLVDSYKSKIDRETDPDKKEKLKAKLTPITTSYLNEYEQKAPLNKDAIKFYTDDPVFADEKEDAETKKSQHVYFTPSKDVKLDDGTTYPANKTVTVPINVAVDLQDRGLGSVSLSTSAPKEDKIGDLSEKDKKQFTRMGVLERQINDKLGVRVDIAGNPVDIYNEFISSDRYGPDIKAARDKIAKNKSLTEDEKDTQAYKWVLQNLVFKGRGDDYDFYIKAKEKFKYLYEIDTDSPPPVDSEFQWKE